MKITSRDFTQGGTIPIRYTCDGEDVHPPLSFADIPKGTKSYALVMHDPDAPGKTFLHWAVWNIPSFKTEIVAGEEIPEAVSGRTDFGRVGYGGPCPPRGRHRYIFTLYALSGQLALQEGATLSELSAEMSERVIDRAELIGTYARGG